MSSHHSARLGFTTLVALACGAVPDHGGAVGFRFKYNSQGSAVASGVSAPVDYVP